MYNSKTQHVVGTHTKTGSGFMLTVCASQSKALDCEKLTNRLHCISDISITVAKQ